MAVVFYGCGDLKLTLARLFVVFYLYPSTSGPSGQSCCPKTTCSNYIHFSNFPEFHPRPALPAATHGLPARELGGRGMVAPP